MTTSTAPPRLRLLVVDDSSFMRGAISRTLGALGPFEVVGQAKDGAEAVRRVLELQPDVVSMDFNMPGMSGADAVREIMRQRPTPIVMFSAHTQRGAAETLEALGAGAVDFVTKPAGEVSADLSKVQDELARKLIAAAQARPTAVDPAAGRAVGAPRSRSAAPAQKTPIPASGPASARPLGASSGLAGQGPKVRASGAPPDLDLPKLCVIAVSTGGPVALSRLLPALPAHTRFAIVVVQHMPAYFTAALAERLHGESALEIREASAGDRPRAGLVLVAPGDRHLEFDARGAVVLTDGPHVHGCRPAADVTMISAAKVYGRRTIGVVLTGMGRDGTAGALAIRRADGHTLAQDEASSVIFGMPKSAIDAGAIEEVASLDEMPSRLRYL